MSSTNLRNKSLCILLNVTSLFFILPSTVISSGDVYIRRAINDENNSTTYTTNDANVTKEEKQEEAVDDTVVWASVAIMYILFGVVLYLVIKTIIDRRRKKIARNNAINDLEVGSNLKKKGYDLDDYEKDHDLTMEEIIKPPPAIIP
ncbi:hypothetical protein RclHR1_02280008 [Rhizophagus clarus]|uniref:Uncharacterized protein n=1 Tax=Rhizophagus clarus TaxID=94130 RepID=A0A2Z6QWV5_9GLOM|nr:hypothetical protein RclHR1_02280008 [Rhizophagus clarus]GES75725.1 hypothetical protein GLOIN_2v1606571 [Rhizophagus clarus]